MWSLSWLVWAKVVSTLTANIEPKPPIGQPHAVVWQGRVFTTDGQLRRYLNAKGPVVQPLGKPASRRVRPPPVKACEALGRDRVAARPRGCNPRDWCNTFVIAVTLKRARRRRLNRLFAACITIALAVGLVLVWIRVVQTLRAPSSAPQYVGQPGALVWDDRVFTSASQLKAYLEAHGLSYTRWAARHPTAFGTPAPITSRHPALTTKTDGDEDNGNADEAEARPSIASPRPRSA